MMDRDVEQLMDGPMAKPVADPVTCSHVWERESLPVQISRPNGYQSAQVYQAFPCEKCGTLLVMNPRKG